MSLLFASLIAFGAYLALDRWLLPLIEGVAFKSLSAEITRIGWVTAFAFSRKIALLATATLGGFWLLAQGTAWLNETFTGFSWISESTLSFLVGTKRFIGAFGGWKTAVTLGLLGLMWLFLIIRNLKARAIEVLDNLKKKSEEGVLPPYEGESDPQMQDLEEQIAHARGEYFRLIYVPDTSLSPQYRWEKHQYLDVLRKRIPKLEKQLEDLRLPHRLVPELTGRGGTTEANSSGWWSQFMLFFPAREWPGQLDK